MVTKVIFLDVDGVINSDLICMRKNGPRCMGYFGISSTLVKKLKKIVDATGAGIVLTSSWKKDWLEYVRRISVNPFGKYLNNKIRKQKMTILDTTIRYELYESDRGMGISGYLSAHPEVTHYVVLDDVNFDDYSFYGILPHFVQTDSKIGLTDSDVEQAINILTNVPMTL